MPADPEGKDRAARILGSAGSVRGTLSSILECCWCCLVLLVLAALVIVDHCQESGPLFARCCPTKLREEQEQHHRVYFHPARGCILATDTSFPDIKDL